MLGLAGCGETTGGQNTQSPSPKEDTIFERVAVDGDFLVVEIAEDSQLSAVNLIAPDGTLYGQQAVEPGVRTVRFRLIELELSQSTHYPPGKYELAAVEDDVIESRTLELRPDLRIREIRQYSGSDSTDNARLAVDVENTGTAPTWIYDIAYRDAPYQEANDEISTYLNIPRLIEPDDIADLIVRPGGRRLYVGQEQPLRFTGEDEPDCGVSVDITIILGTGSGDSVDQRLRVDLDGSPEPLGLGRGYTCSNGSVQILDTHSSEEAL
ncbi:MULTISPECIES: hypothetical protein [Salinibaculum]|uniref:hypothetical protein n=1 Tax=Salinibaculum TaxID=2732368 RepID=UPI0030CF7EB2